MDSLIVFVAKYFLYISIVIVGVYWLRASTNDKFSLAWKLVGGGLLALAMARVGAHFYYDTRPFVAHHIKPLFPHAADNGFPSDHALLTSFLGFSMIAYSRRVAAALLVNAVLVGWARVAAHVHSPIDIIGSFVFAGVSAAIIVWIDHLVSQRGAAR
ncbi:MAG: phosphatase PAP2 family protein [Acidobacteria bacterium]|nr:phosphatase PAP2 family protein [Acidobacteriota bacterium]